jgi:hypothetical protein
VDLVDCCLPDPAAVEATTVLPALYVAAASAVALGTDEEGEGVAVAAALAPAR